MIVRSLTSWEEKVYGPAEALAIHQPAHSRISGELARCWNRWPALEDVARSELCIAAELHDLGYVFEAIAPLWNAATGLPCSFQQLPIATHLDVWRRSVEWVEVLSTYAAYFVSRHTTYLAERHSPVQSSDDKMLLEDFVKEESRRQECLLHYLNTRSRHSGSLSDSQADLQQKLVAAWDAFSLGLCGALPAPLHITNLNQDSFVLTSPKEGGIMRLDPWPFGIPSIHLSWQARLIVRTFRDQADLNAYFPQAPVIFMELELQPG